MSANLGEREGVSANLGESDGCYCYLEKKGRCESAIWRRRGGV